MRPVSFRLAFLALVVALPLAAVACKKDGEAGAGAAGAGAATKQYSTKGVVKSFGPDRKFANIAHENIPGYMSAMTMSFEAKSADQLKDLAVGDKVALTFSADGGKHVLTAIKKEP
jgi:Cu/Ag efflux protein CusF